MTVVVNSGLRTSDYKEISLHYYTRGEFSFFYASNMGFPLRCLYTGERLDYADQLLVDYLASGTIRRMTFS
jgi:hypothetical protein